MSWRFNPSRVFHEGLKIGSKSQTKNIYTVLLVGKQFATVWSLFSYTSCVQLTFSNVSHFNTHEATLRAQCTHCLTKITSQSQTLFSPPPVYSLELCRCSLCRSWCLLPGYSEDSRDFHSLVSSILQSDSCLQSLPWCSSHTALFPN